MNTQNIQYDFFHRLYDTLLLLGAPKSIADIVEKQKDGQLTQADIEELRTFNCELITKAKDRLAYIHTIKLNTLPEP